MEETDKRLQAFQISWLLLNRKIMRMVYLMLPLKKEADVEGKPIDVSKAVEAVAAIKAEAEADAEAEAVAVAATEVDATRDITKNIYNREITREKIV